MNIKTMMKNLEFDELSPIQDEVLNKFNTHLNIVGLAPTGTGKTHAYLLPILNRIKSNDELEVIILVPTNELIIQVFNMFKATGSNLRVRALYGTVDMLKEVNRFKNNPPQIVITTPQKLIDLTVKHNAINLDLIKYFVLDEADMLFDDSFISLIDPIIENITNARFLLFSASLTERMNPFIKKYFGNFILIDTTKLEVLNINYYLVSVIQDRLSTLERLLSNLNPYMALIFVSRNEDIPIVYNYLKELNFNIVSYSSMLNLRARKRIIDDILDLKYQYVVTSDLLSRGIDFDSSHIIHYDLPHKLEYFIHRSGRTARMDKDGDVYLLYEETDSRKIERLTNQGIEFQRVRITKDGLKKVIKHERKYDKEIKTAIKKVKKPKEVKPGYKKKYEQEVKKEVQKIRKRRFRNASFRKSR